MIIQATKKLRDYLKSQRSLTLMSMTGSRIGMEHHHAQET